MFENPNVLTKLDKARINYEEFLDYQVKIDSIIKFENVPYNTLPGVAPERLMLDLYIKEDYLNDTSGKLKPLIFFIHGGTWRSGSKEFSLEKIEMILDKGYIFVSTNYRLSPDPVNIYDSTRVKFPMHIQDVAKSFAKVYEVLPFFKGDTSKITVMGHSAGGNLAVSLATIEHYLAKYEIPITRIKSAVNLDGVGLNLDSLIRSINGNFKNEFINAFGNNPEDWKKASPALNFKKDSKVANILLICQDSKFRSQFSYEFSEKLSKAGIHSAVYLAYNFDHNEILMNFCSQETEITKVYTKNIFNFIEESYKK
jgi:hypothetical protein